MNGKGGFTLVELVVVVAIVAILAAVATPAYINYVNRSKQGQAESMLFTARLEEEEFYTDNGYYASTIACLPTFSSASTCLSQCSNAICANNAFLYPYTFSVSVPPSPGNAAYYQIQAWRVIGNGQDILTISANTTTPTVQNTSALNWSVFQWLFGQ